MVYIVVLECVRMDLRSCVYKYVHEMETRQEEVRSDVETNEQNLGKVGGRWYFSKQV